MATIVQEIHFTSAERYLPLLLAEGYLWATFLAYWFTPYTAETENPVMLILFVTFAYICLAFGYIQYMRHWEGREIVQVAPGRWSRVILIVALLHLLLLGLANLSLRGGFSLGELQSALNDPGNAYKQRAGMFEERTSAEASRLGQLVTFSYVLYYLGVSLAIRFWSFVGWPYRLLAATAGAAYAASFLLMGTLKGLGDLLLMSLTGYAVWSCCSKHYFFDKKLRQPRSRLFAITAALLTIAFICYMALNLYSRLDAYGVTSQSEQQISETGLSRVVPVTFAVAITAVIDYPTHGYCGLAYNLQTPFEWTYGRGNSLALDGYLAQYADSPTIMEKTFPLRTEEATGWPAWMNWCTIFPWLASDLTFPGAALMMGVVGWLLAYGWRIAIRGEPYGMCVLCQLVVLIAFVPANNQLLIMRTGFWGVIGTLVWGILRRLLSKRRVFTGLYQPGIFTQRCAGK